jgi:outer membrane protein assembly factor BamB
VIYARGGGLTVFSGLSVTALLVGTAGCLDRPAIPPPIVAVQPTTGGLLAFDLRSGATVANLSLGSRYAGYPAAAGGDVYWSGGPVRGEWTESVIAFDLDGHAERWRSPLPGQVRYILGSGRGPYVVALGAYDMMKGGSAATLFALEQATGAVRWSATRAAVWEIVPADSVLVLLTDEGLEALDAATGALKWKRQSGWNRSFEGPAVLAGDAYVVQVQGRLINNARSLYALDLANGSEKWSIPVAVNYAQSSVRAVSDGGALVLFGSSLGVETIDLASRKPRWRADCTGGGALASAVAVCETNASDLAAWSVESGRRLWETALPEDAWTAPVIGADAVLVRSFHRLYGLDLPTGRMRYTVDLDHPAPEGSKARVPSHGEPL